MGEVHSFGGVNDLCCERPTGGTFFSPLFRRVSPAESAESRGTGARPDPTMGVKRPNNCPRGCKSEAELNSEEHQNTIVRSAAILVCNETEAVPKEQPPAAWPSNDSAEVQGVTRRGGEGGG